jgi:DNA-binding MarR family transcriptional regulator
MKKTLPIFLLFLIFGCQTLPKITTFVETSSQMRKGINDSFISIDKSLTANELTTTVSSDQASAGILANTLMSLKSEGDKLKKMSKVVDNSLLGIVSYAGALNNLVDKGNSGEKDALQVTKALTDILNELKAEPAATIVGLSAEGIAKINGQIARVRAAKNLQVIMQEANPTLEEYAVILPKLLDELKSYNRSVFQAKRQLLITPNTMNKSIADYNNELEKEYINIYQEITLIATYKNSRDSTILKTLKNMDPFITDAKSAFSRQSDLISKSKDNEKERERILPVVEKGRSIQAKFLEEYNTTNQLLEKSKDAIRAWTATHTNIQEQLQKKSLPNFQELIEIVDDLKAIREKLKTLNP